MAVTLSLNPEQERRLHDAALTRGLDDGTLLNESVQKALDGYAARPAKRVLGLHAGNYSISADFGDQVAVRDSGCISDLAVVHLH
jgi:hypothetical protein